RQAALAGSAADGAPCAVASWSGCNCGKLSKGQAAKIVGGLGRLARCGKDGSLVRFQKLDPVRDVAGVANVAVESKFSGQERGAKFGNQFLRSVMARAEAGFQIAIKTRLVP